MGIEDNISDLSERLSDLERLVVSHLNDFQIAQLTETRLVTIAFDHRTGYQPYIRREGDGTFVVCDRWNGGPPNTEIQAYVSTLADNGMKIRVGP